QMVVLHPVGDLHVFVRDRVVVTDELERGLMLEILPLAAHGLMCFGEPLDCLVPSARVANDSKPRSMPVSCPVGSNGGISTSAPEKHPYQPSASRPMVTVLGIPCSELQRARPPHRHTANLGQDQEAVLELCAIGILGIGETVEPVTAMKAGIARGF